MKKWLKIIFLIVSSIFLAVIVSGILEWMWIRRDGEILNDSLLLIKTNRSQEGLHKCYTQTRYDIPKQVCFIADLSMKLANYDLPTREYCENMPRIKKVPLKVNLKNLFKSNSEKLSEKEDEKYIMDTCLAYSVDY